MDIRLKEMLGTTTTVYLHEASISHFRGESFHVLAMLVGEYGYASPALVHTVIAPGNSGKLEEQQSIQELGNMCGNLTYSVRTPQESIFSYSCQLKVSWIAIKLCQLPY